MIILNTFINQIKKKSNIALYCIEQEEGRGRKNREWISKKGDLTCSFLIEKKN